jgi:aryl-alcohol dehydrogenase-like predicted oxidoreductase
VQLALGFTCGREDACSIIGATSMPQLRENLAAASVRLSAAVLDEIEAIHLRYTNPAP